MLGWLYHKIKKTAILAYYKILATPNPPLNKIKLQGLNENVLYKINEKDYYGGVIKR